MSERQVFLNLKLKIYSTGLRQYQLAKMVGIDEAYLSRIINGVREPGQQVRAQIANALGCDEEWLFQRLTRHEAPRAIWQSISPAGEA